MSDPFDNPDMVEVKGGRSVELLVATAMKQLGVDDPDQVIVEVVVEPVREFPLAGGRDAVVRVYREEAVGKWGYVPDSRKEPDSDFTEQSDPEPPAAEDVPTETSVEPETPVETPAPRSSEELLEQAKKWMNRS